MLFDYPVHLDIRYTTDQGYRQAVRTLFSMKTNLSRTLDDVDEITRDELDYEEEAASAFLDAVYKQTRNHPAFQELYVLAAGAMLSEDPEIGLAVLFSYDYLALFHECMCYYCHHQLQLDTECSAYVTLRSRLITPRRSPVSAPTPVST